MITLKSPSGDFIYFDVVTKYSQNFSSQVSQHPVDGSGVVTDHVIKQNPKIQLTGFISGADFNFSKPDPISEDRVLLGVGSIVIDNDIAPAITVNYDNNSTNLLPDVAGQFFSDSLPEIDNLVEGRDASYSERILFSILEQFYKQKAELTLFEFDLGVIVNQIDSVFITSLSLEESAQNGDSLAFNITLEKVTFATLLEEEIPEDVQESFKKQNEDKVKKGGQGGTEVTNTDGEPNLSTAYSNFFLF